MKKTITTLAILAIATGAYGATTYRSISITPEAKLKVVAMAKELKITQRDTASKMILEWQPKNEVFLTNLGILFQTDTSDTYEKLYKVCKVLGN